MNIPFNLIIIFYQFCGMHPILLANNIANNSNNKTNNKYQILLILCWSYSHIILITIYILLICIYNREIFNAIQHIGEFSVLANGGLIILTHLIILLEAVLSRNNLHNIWVSVEQVDRCLRKLNKDFEKIDEDFKLCFVYKFWFWQIVSIVTEFIIIFIESAEWQLYTFALLFSTLIGRSKHLQHTMFVNLITSRFRIIKIELENISKTNLTSNSQNTINLVLDNINNINEVQLMLYKILKQLDRVCGTSQLANLTQNFVQISGDLYRIYAVMTQSGSSSAAYCM